MDETLDLGRPLRSESVELGRPDRPLGPVADIVVAEGVGDQHDDVFF